MPKLPIFQSMYGELNPLFRNEEYRKRLMGIQAPTTAAMTVQQYTEAAMSSFDRAHQTEAINEHRGNPHDVLWDIAQALRGDHVLVEYCSLDSSVYASITKWVKEGERVPYEEADLIPIRDIYKIFDERIAEEETFVLGIVKRSIERLPQEEIKSRYAAAYRNIDLALTTYARHNRPIEIFLSTRHKEILFYAKLSTP